MWNYSGKIAIWLKFFTGEKNIDDFSKYCKQISPTDRRRSSPRVYLDEMPEEALVEVIDFFSSNKIIVVSDIIKGRGGLSADWMLVTRYNKDKNTSDWILKDINTVMNFFGQGKVGLSRFGSLRIGRITMQRKGGTPDPTKLQFKINPCELFNLENDNV